MTNEELAVKLTEVESRSKSNTHQIEELKESTKVLTTLAAAVERMSVKQEWTNQTVNTIKTDLEEIKAKPAKRWDIVVTAIITAVVGVVIGLLLK